MTLGEKIKTLRKGKYTQEELAEIVGVHINTILRWERDGRIPTADKLKLLAEALDTTPSELLDVGDNVRKVQSIEIKQDTVDLKTPVVNDTPISSPLLLKGVDLITSGQALYYEKPDGERFIIPATPENQSWFREIMGNSINNVVATC